VLKYRPPAFEVGVSVNLGQHETHIYEVDRIVCDGVTVEYLRFAGLSAADAVQHMLRQVRRSARS